jgi:hypothetical protein
MSQVYPWDRGTNYAVEMGRRVARMILEDHQQGRWAAGVALRAASLVSL